MSCATAQKNPAGLNYVVAFSENLFGGNCTVEISSNLQNGELSVSLALNPRFGSTPVFKMTLEDLEALLECLRSVKLHAALLQELPEGAEDQQLNFERGEALLIVVHPKGKPARFSLNMGSIHKEGPLEELNIAEVEKAVNRLNGLKAKVQEKTGRNMS